MEIIHLTDPHFGDPQPAFDIHVLAKALNELKHLFCRKDTYLVLSGDVSYQGREHGYALAQRFIADTWICHGGERSRFLACPGNHDLCNERFDAFDAFTYGVRRDHRLTYEREPSHVVEFDDVVFLCVNSAYHRDYKYGLVDDTVITRQLVGLEKIAKRKVAVVHHHILGVFRDDTSAIRNALQLITLLDKYNFEILIHGHQHAQADVVLGESKIKVYSGRSLNFTTRGLVNGLAIYSSDDQGAWSRTIKVLSNDASLATGQAFFTAEKK